jgi:hypothetical protein
MGEQRNADEAENPGNAADRNGETLLEAVANAERIEDPNRCQQPTKCPAKITRMPIIAEIDNDLTKVPNDKVLSHIGDVIAI